MSAAFVTVRGIRRRTFVEFEFGLDDGLLAVELILPATALEEFALARDADLRFVDDAARDAFARAAHPVREPSALSPPVG